jgi:ribonuclease Z
MIERVEHKIRAYTWNLLGGYAAGVSLVVTEVGEDGPAARARFALAEGFAREPLPPPDDRSALVDEENLRVTAVTLDHGIPCLGYAIEEKARVNVWKNRLAEMGLESGPWLRGLKTLALTEAPDATLVVAPGPDGERRLPLGLLRERVLTVARGRKLAYVTDIAWTRGNVERVCRLAQGAWLLAIEATFLDRDRERAAARRHLTARQAGTLARLAGAERVLPFHFSPRHAEEEAALRAELEAAYAGEAMAPLPGEG